MAAKIKIAISIPQDNLDILDLISKRDDRSRNWIINQAIDLYIKTNLSKK